MCKHLTHAVHVYTSSGLRTRLFPIPFPYSLFPASPWSRGEEERRKERKGRRKEKRRERNFPFPTIDHLTPPPKCAPFSHATSTHSSACAASVKRAVHEKKTRPQDAPGVWGQSTHPAHGRAPHSTPSVTAVREPTAESLSCDVRDVNIDKAVEIARNRIE